MGLKVKGHLRSFLSLMVSFPDGCTETECQLIFTKLLINVQYNCPIKFIVLLECFTTGIFMFFATTYRVSNQNLEAWTELL